MYVLLFLFCVFIYFLLSLFLQRKKKRLRLFVDYFFDVLFFLLICLTEM